jgi:hypothetical protein
MGDSLMSAAIDAGTIAPYFSLARALWIPNE